MTAAAVLDPPTVDGFDAVPLERLETEITSLTGQISASRSTCTGAAPPWPPNADF